MEELNCKKIIAENYFVDFGNISYVIINKHYIYIKYDTLHIIKPEGGLDGISLTNMNEIKLFNILDKYTNIRRKKELKNMNYQFLDEIREVKICQYRDCEEKFYRPNQKYCCRKHKQLARRDEKKKENELLKYLISNLHTYYNKGESIDYLKKIIEYSKLIEKNKNKYLK